MKKIHFTLLNHVCFRESKRNSGPKVHRSESTRAQANYNLIEKIINSLKKLRENENQIEYKNLVFH